MKSLLTGILVFFSAAFFAQETEKISQTTVNDTLKTKKVNELEGVTIFGNKKQSRNHLELSHYQLVV